MTVMKDSVYIYLVFGVLKIKWSVARGVLASAPSGEEEEEGGGGRGRGGGGPRGRTMLANVQGGLPPATKGRVEWPSPIAVKTNP
jgi:hypothetical protein